MSEGRVPTPDFDGARYQRPNKDWICGHAGDGCPCRIGPSPGGDCRATTECRPLLVTPPGETKGAWQCTRPKDLGGPCAAGPRPDGECGRVIPKCQPVRSLRARRGLVTRAVVAASVGVLLIGLSRGMRESFVNPAPLSAQHSGPEFARLAAQHGVAGMRCASCHAEATQGFAGLSASAIRAAGASLQFTKFLTPHPRDFSRMDQSCAACHPARDFHQPTVVGGVSCSSCHLEHQGALSLAAVAGEHCTACHGDEMLMHAFAGAGREIPAAFFAKKTTPGLAVHASARPAGGYTQVIHGFAIDHPEFQVRREQQADGNTLKFNHQLHLTGENIPLVGGRKLDCAYCHQPDGAGAFMQRLTFEQSCRSCHALNFDENNPGLELPHGDASSVRAYLHSLPMQYADYAGKRLGIIGDRAVNAYVEKQMRWLRARTLGGESLERAVFFADARTGEATVIAGLHGAARAKFAGCAYCHEVTPQGEAAPIITPPAASDRWLLHAAFNHAKHQAVACTQCHAAEQSTRTADVILPSQKTCVECHSPKGGVSDACSTCHNYHNDRPAGMTLTAVSNPRP